MRSADLHTHTICSDGSFTPEELVNEAVNRDLAAISINDHDTVAGILPAVKSGKELGIEVIPGIELTSEYEGIEIHILGYFIDPENPALTEKLASLREYRVSRIYKIAEKLNGLGVRLKPEDVFDLSVGGTVGRLHIAMAMVKRRLVGSLAEAFQRYIGDRGPAYVSGFRLPPQEAIALIRGSGGIAVLAHPYLLQRDDLIPLFIANGIRGIEAYYPEHSQGQVNFYLDLAQKNGLLVTGGSDFHGKGKPDIKLGLVRVPYELVEKLKAAL